MDPLSKFTPPEGSWDLVNDTAYIEFKVTGEVIFGKRGRRENTEEAQKEYNEIKEKLQRVVGARIAFNDEERTIRFFHHDREVKAIASVAGFYDIPN